MKKPTVWVLWLLIIAPIATSWAKNYYLSSQGNDANMGTQDKPWRTMAPINRTLFQPGDQLLLRGGDQFEGPLILHERSLTTSSQPIVIGSYGRGKATIRVARADAILIRNLGGVIVKDLIVACTNPATNQGYGVRFLNDRPGNKQLDFVRITRVEASGFKWAGIYVGGVPTDLPNVKAPAGSRFGFRNVHIDSCTAYGNMYYGIYVTAAWNAAAVDYGNENVRISRCVAYRNTGDSTYTANHSGSGIMLDDTDGGLIEHCIAYENGALNAGRTGGPCGIWTHASNRVIIQHCEAYANRTAGAADGGGFDLDGGVTNSVVQYCYSHDNDGAGFLVWNYEGAPHRLADNVIRYNISSNDGRKHSYGGIHIGTSGLPVTNFLVYHNTIYMPPAPGAKPYGIWTGGSKPNKNIHFYNNLIVTTGEVSLVMAEPGQKAIALLGNAYWRMGQPFKLTFDGKEYNDLNTFRTATAQEHQQGKPVGLFADPKLHIPVASQTIGSTDRLTTLRGYQLQAGSPLEGAGVVIPEGKTPKPAYDFWHHPLPANSAPTIGAHQGAR